ncbi:MAG: cytochrome C, partial [Nevskia sp.]|nr:cytochrome C [Nevskia sp.]
YIPFGKGGPYARTWLNLRMALQYTQYLQFNGGVRNYDGSGRDAADNNTLYLFTWLEF